MYFLVSSSKSGSFLCLTLSKLKAEFRNQEWLCQPQCALRLYLCVLTVHSSLTTPERSLSKALCPKHRKLSSRCLQSGWYRTGNVVEYSPWNSLALITTAKEEGRVKRSTYLYQDVKESGRRLWVQVLPRLHSIVHTSLSYVTRSCLKIKTKNCNSLITEILTSLLIF